jgi:glutamate formiminotransferase / 5-formyltetrahydrofolate cyclo-ligase
MPLLLAIPNFSEGRDKQKIEAIADALMRTGHARLLDTHSDPDHNRTVLTATGAQGDLSKAVVSAASAAIELLDITAHLGAHPRVGTIDVAPIVHPHPEDRGAACAEALTLADRLAYELHLPVFLYGALTQHQQTRANVRRGGPSELQRRIDQGELKPDFGPQRLHPRAGAVLVSARPPLAAFNVELEPPATLADAMRIAALIREGGAEGLPSVRAIGIQLHNPDRAQVSTNVEDHLRTPLAAVVNAIARHAKPARTELVGLVPARAFDGFPARLEVRNRRHLEDALQVTRDTN